MVLPSLFEEQVEHDAMAARRHAWLGHEFGEATGGYFPALDDYNTGPDEYIDSLIAGQAAAAGSR